MGHLMVPDTDQRGCTTGYIIQHPLTPVDGVGRRSVLLKTQPLINGVRFQGGKCHTEPDLAMSHLLVSQHHVLCKTNVSRQTIDVYNWLQNFTSTFPDLATKTADDIMDHAN